MATKEKTDPFTKDTRDLLARLRGSDSPQGIPREEQQSPAYIVNSLRINIVIATTFYLALSLFGDANAFQNTVLSSEQMCYVCPLPYYVEWFRSQFSSISLPPGGNLEFNQSILNKV